MKIKCGFWLQWVLVTLSGFLVSLYWIEAGERPDIGIIEGAIGGAIIGSAQWFVLRRQFSQARWWILASIVSWGLLGGNGIGALGWMAPRTLNVPLRVIYGTINGAMAGTVIGVIQWFVIQKQAQNARQWILASTLSWGTGLAAGWVIGAVLRVFTGVFLGEVVGLVVTWLIVAGITGIALLLILPTPPIQRGS